MRGHVAVVPPFSQRWQVTYERVAAPRYPVMREHATTADEGAVMVDCGAARERMRCLMLTRSAWSSRDSIAHCLRPDARSLGATVFAESAGLDQPTAPPQRRRLDLSFIHVEGMLACSCAILHGCARYVFYGDVRADLRRMDLPKIRQRARSPDGCPRVIAYGGPQFIARVLCVVLR